MNFFSKLVLKSLVEGWAKAQGVKKLQQLAASPTRDFSTHVPLARKVFEVWTRDVDSAPPVAPDCRRIVTVTLDGVRFFMYGRVRDK